MLEVLVMRHGKSDWGEPNQADFDRPLKKRGQKASQIMGKELVRRNALPDIILCSAAKRTRETVANLLQGAGQDIPVEYFRSFYDEGHQAMLAALHKLPAQVNRAMLVGHNPTIENIILLAADVLTHNLKVSTGTLAQLSARDTASWDLFDWELSRLDWVIRPKDVQNLHK